METQMSEVDYADARFEDILADVIADGIVDADEVSKLDARIFDDGIVDEDEADFMFKLNDAVSGNTNCPEYKAFFVKVIAAFVLEDEKTPGAIDDDEANYIVTKMLGDGTVDEAEQALIDYLKENATDLGKLKEHPMFV
jgi:hypothetical protein